MSSEPSYFRIQPGALLPDIEAFRWFRAVVILEADYTSDWQMVVSRWLVDSGCLYMMAWGPRCSDWDDSVDYAQILKFLPGEAPEDQFVMTTWHNDESLEEVFWFSQVCGNDAYDRISHSLIVHVGETEREPEFLALYQRAADFAEREAPDSV